MLLDRDAPIFVLLMEESLQRAAKAIRDASALLITTGAGMGVDSGLGTFRGRNAGVWPPLKALRMDFSEMSSPGHFQRDPYLAWAFWHYRHEAYTKGQPHNGYNLLAKWGQSKPQGLWSVTSNIDGHWARTPGVGPERIFERHGALTHMQTVDDDGRIWETDPHEIESLRVPTWDLQPGEKVEARLTLKGDWQEAVVDQDGASILAADGKTPLEAMGVRRPGGSDLMRVEEGSKLPVCPETGKAARPNVLMFMDYYINFERIEEQHKAYDAWEHKLKPDTELAIVEVGAGKAVPTIRRHSEMTMERFSKAKLIRINFDDSDIPNSLRSGDRGISIGGIGALDALTRIDALI